MELLRIDDSHDAYYLKNGSWAAVRDIMRDDLLKLIQDIAESEEVLLAECTPDNEIRNPIERTIYLELYKVLKDLDENRELYLSEIRDSFDDLERRYGFQ